MMFKWEPYNLAENHLAENQLAENHLAEKNYIILIIVFYIYFQ